MDPAKQTARFEDVENGEEFLTVDGRRYMKLPAAGPGPIPDDVDVAGFVPSHTGRHPDDADPDIGERTVRLPGEPERLIRRDFEDDEPVIRDDVQVDGTGA